MMPSRAWLPLALLALAACGRDDPAPVAGTAPADPAPVVATPPPAAPAEASTRLDASVVAGNDTLATLQARHGADNAVAGKVPGAEGTEFDGWVLFPGDPTRRVYLYVDEASGGPGAARVLDRESAWERADGIRMGLTLAELAARNGAPVGFVGFDWDYGGGVTGFNGGKLQDHAGSGAIVLCPPEGEFADMEGYPSGDSEFDSTNAWVVAHPPVVCEFSVDLAAAEGG